MPPQCRYCGGFHNPEDNHTTPWTRPVDAELEDLLAAQNIPERTAPVTKPDKLQLTLPRSMVEEIEALLVHGKDLAISRLNRERFAVALYALEQARLDAHVLVGR